MKKAVSYILMLMVLIPMVKSQNLPCGTDEMVAKSIANNPSLKQLIEIENQKALAYEKSHYKQKAAANYVIPIVFHVMHTYGPENVSKAQIEDAVRIINEDFQKLNADTNDVISQFKNIAANSQIEFRLAKIDPWGNCTEGITRHYTPLTHSAGENVKDIISWNTSMYLNVWVVSNIESGAGAYAYYPGTAPGASHEGIVCRASQLGSIGASNGGNFSARTLSHEIGHYLNLAHTWGSTNQNAVSTNCSSDDGVSDTPNTIGSNLNCDLGQTTCGSLDNVQNYMDYATCAKMFTEGQKTRMHAALNSSAGSRNNLWKASNLVATGTNDGYVSGVCAPVADFDANTYRICAGDSITFYDLSYNAPVDGSWTWNWTFNGGTPSTSNLQNPTITYNSPGVYDVTLNVTNSAGSDVYTKTSYITVGATSGGETAPFVEGIENSSFPSSPNGSLKDWEITSNGNNTWNRTTVSAATGSASLRINNKVNDLGTVNELISPPIDFSNVNSSEAVVKFKVAYAMKDQDSDDKLRLYVSTDCGKNWVMRWGRGAAQLVSNGGNYVSGTFIPNSSQWIEYTANLAMFANQSNVRVKFQMESNGGNFLYLDDINIGTTPLSVNELQSENNLNVYPNPINKDFSITLDLKQNAYTLIEVYNITGESIFKQYYTLSEGKNQIGINKNLSSGMYFIKASSEAFTLTKKIIVK